MSAESAFTRTWPVGRYCVTLNCPSPKPGAVLAAVCEWSPTTPQRLTAEEIEQYRAGRDAALKDMAAKLSITVAVLDL